jgi:hypothetical protein
VTTRKRHDLAKPCATVFASIALAAAFCQVCAIALRCEMAFAG